MSGELPASCPIREEFCLPALYAEYRGEEVINYVGLPNVGNFNTLRLGSKEVLACGKWNPETCLIAKLLKLTTDLRLMQ